MIMSEDKKIVFIHIPRTGGTTIRQIFNQPLQGGQKTAIDCHRELGVEWPSYYKFAVVRNPWDRLVSQYMFFKVDPIGSLHRNLGPSESFPQFIKRKLGPIQGQLRFYLDFWLGDGMGNLLPDRIVRFENFVPELTEVLNQFNIDVEIPHLNQIEKPHYSLFYDAESRDLVADKFRDDIEYFGYVFETLP